MKTIKYNNKTYEVKANVSKKQSCSLCDLYKVCIKGFETIKDMPCLGLEAKQYLKEVKQ